MECCEDNSDITKNTSKCHTMTTTSAVLYVRTTQYTHKIYSSFLNVETKTIFVQYKAYFICGHLEFGNFSLSSASQMCIFVYCSEHFISVKSDNLS